MAGFVTRRFAGFVSGRAARGQAVPAAGLLCASYRPEVVRPGIGTVPGETERDISRVSVTSPQAQLGTPQARTPGQLTWTNPALDRRVSPATSDAPDATWVVRSTTRSALAQRQAMARRTWTMAAPGQRAQQHRRKGLAPEGPTAVVGIPPGVAKPREVRAMDLNAAAPTSAPVSETNHHQRIRLHPPLASRRESSPARRRRMLRAKMISRERQR